MNWLIAGILYSGAYAVTGWLLRDQLSTLSVFRGVALLVPPMTAAIVIVRRRQTWRGCQWLFWATIALGLTMSAIGLTGWAADELMFRQADWLAWPAVFALFGSIAPLYALLAQPHRGSRDPLAATTAVDIAGLAVVTGFLYSFFVVSPELPLGAGGSSAPSLLVVSELQQGLVLLGMMAATFAARRTPWRDTYRRLALGTLVAFATLTLSNLGALQGVYRSGSVFDFTWILPFAFYPWAASLAPASDEDDRPTVDQKDLARPRPWVIFAAVTMLPFLDFGLRRFMPDESLGGLRDLTTAIAIISVLPLLVARIAAERAELRQAGGVTRLLEQVIQQAQDSILILTPDGRCVHANAAFCRATGWSAEELTRLHHRDLMVGDSPSAEDIQALVGSGVWRGTLSRTRKDGASFPVSATLTALVDARGTTTHIVSVDRDISGERRLREQLIRSERLSAVGQLVAGVAHELNNPLQAIMGLTELMLEEDITPTLRQDLEQVKVDGERAANVVRHLLAFARQSVLERAVFDFNEIVRSTLALRAYDLQSANVIVEEQYAGDAPLVVVNREEIQQVVLNLLLNAEYVMRHAGGVGTIQVRTRRQDGSAVLEVTDSGSGVPPELTGRIFEPFFTTKSLGEGTGLGLSVSLGIAEAHGGSLALTSSARGACFALTLPLGPSTSVLEATPLEAIS